MTSLAFQKSENGTLIIELALVVGILAFAAMGGLEIAYFLQKSQIGVSLTRELANNIVRDCYDVCDLGTTKECAEQEVLTIQNIATQVDPSMRVRARIWQRESTAATANPPCILQSALVPETVGVKKTQFTSPRSEIAPFTGSSESDFMVIAEVEASYSPLTSFALLIFGQNSVYYHGTLI